MKRGFIVLIIIVVSAALVFVYQAQSKNKGNPVTKTDSRSGDKRSGDKRDGDKLFSRRLNNIIMPAADIIGQVRDVGRAVAAGDTDPGLALSIYAKADEYLADTRVKLDEINTTNRLKGVKEKADNIIKESIKSVDDLTDLTKSSNKVKMDAVSKKLDSKLTDLRRLFKKAPETKQ